MTLLAITERSPISPPYKRRRPEQTLLYHIIERHYPAFRDVMAAQSRFREIYQIAIIQAADFRY